MRSCVLLFCFAACAAPPPNEYGFVTRDPDMSTMPCGYPGCGPVQKQIDYVCTLHAADRDLVIYTQWEPTSFDWSISYSPTGDTRAWAYDRATDETQAITAAYEYGGPHHNASIDVTIGDRIYRLNHSSYAPGARTCHAPDCVQTLDLQRRILDNGCTAERTRPEVCVELEDATIPPLVDDFEPCPGL
jgi:hypothetical protein